jgi:hypothetical protein
MRSWKMRLPLLCALLALVLTTIGFSTDSEAARWKIGADGTCYFDDADEGPDQCIAQPAGRWKIDGDTCVFDSSDSGPDQCQP